MIYRISKPSLLLLTVCVASLLAACEPNWMPDGYTYHDNTYKSANPPKSFKFSEDQRRTMTAEQLQQFDLMARTIVANLSARGGVPPKPVYILKPAPMTPFYASLDSDLRKALRDGGYTLSDMPNGAYVYTYNATLLHKDNDDSSAVPNVHVVLEVYDQIRRDAKTLAREAGDYFVRGANLMSVQYSAVPDVFVPQPSGPARSYNE